MQRGFLDTDIVLYFKAVWFKTLTAFFINKIKIKNMQKNEFKLILTRENDNTLLYTRGVLETPNKNRYYTLEPKNRFLDEGMSTAQILNHKIAGKTAIPRGTYIITFKYSYNLQDDVIYLNNVKGFKSIYIHTGNRIKDTRGCILIGEHHEGNVLINSYKAFIKLKKEISEALANKYLVTITIQ
jgi:hypothetical protein